MSPICQMGDIFVALGAVRNSELGDHGTERNAFECPLMRTDGRDTVLFGGQMTWLHYREELHLGILESARESGE